MGGRYDLGVRVAAVELLVDGLRGGLSISSAAHDVYDRFGVAQQIVIAWARQDGWVLRPSFSDFADARDEIIRLRAECRAKNAEIARLRALRGRLPDDRSGV